MTRNDKIVLVLGIAGAVGLFFLGWECHDRKVTKSAGTVKTVTKDSIVYRDKPVPYKVDSLVYVKGKDGKPYPVYDTLFGAGEVIIQPADTVAILKRFNEVAYYKREKDTGRVKVTIMDTVFQNRLQNGSVKIVFSDTTTETTIVLQQPKRFVVSFTASVLGNMNSPLYGQGGGMSVTLPNGKAYQVQIFNVPGHRPMVMATHTRPIRLVKRK